MSNDEFDPGGSDDISSCKCFLALKEKERELFHQVTSNLLTVFVPRDESITLDTEIDSSFLEKHIFSLLEEKENVTIYQSLSKGKVAVEIDKARVRTCEGYEEERSVQILSQETYYDDNFRSYRVILLSAPLDGPYVAVASSHGGAGSHKKPQCVREYKELLYSCAENVPALQQLDMTIHDFNESYTIIKGHLPHVVRKLKTYCEDALDSILVDRKSLADNPSHQLELYRAAIASYVMDGVHHKVFSALRSTNSMADARLVDKIDLLRENVEPTDLGLSGMVNCDLSQAVSILKKLNEYTTPVDKLLCIKDGAAAITEAARAWHEENLAGEGSHNGRERSITVSNDELLPLLILTIIKAEVECLETNSQYLQMFELAGIGATALGFHLANFCGAVQFLSSESADETALNARSRRRAESEHVKLMKTLSILPDSERDPLARPRAITSAVENMRKNVAPDVIDPDSPDLRPRHGSSVSTVVTDGAPQPSEGKETVKKEAMGDFLAALLDDDGDVSSSMFD